jgi:hypothetical protein
MAGPIPIATSPLSAANTSVVMVTCNSDIMHITSRINRAIYEMQHSQSAGITNTIEPDRKRMEKAFADLRKHVDSIFSRGIPDNVKTQPEQVVLPDVAEKQIENDDYKAVIDQLYILRDEIIASASSRLGGGFLEPDHIRATEMLNRIDDLFTLFIPAISPVDNPESTPSVAMVGHGRQGN